MMAPPASVKKKGIEEIHDDLMKVYWGIHMLEFCLRSPESILDLPEELLRNVKELKQLIYTLDFENQSINRCSIERGIEDHYYTGEIVSYDFACDIYEHLCLLKVRVQRFYKEKMSFECKNEVKHVYDMKLLVGILEIFVLKWVKFLKENMHGEENWVWLKKKNKVEIKKSGVSSHGKEEKEKLSKKKVEEEESLWKKKRKGDVLPVKSNGVEVFAEITEGAAARENKGEELKKEKEKIKKKR